MGIFVMASKLKCTVIAFCLAVLIAIIGWVAVYYSSPAHLSIPSCDIEVQCKKVLLATSPRLQSIVDDPNLAAMYGRYVLDHAGQDFDGLWDIEIGDRAYIDQEPYICRFITTGWSDMGIRADSGNLPNADFYLCTCVPGGRPYEIYIIGIDKE